MLAAGGVQWSLSAIRLIDFFVRVVCVGAVGVGWVGVCVVRVNGALVSSFLSLWGVILDF